METSFSYIIAVMDLCIFTMETVTHLYQMTDAGTDFYREILDPVFKGSLYFLGNSFS